MSAPRELVFSGASGPLEGMLHLPAGVPQGIAVVAHPLSTMGGTMHNKVVTTLTHAFAELGYAVLRFNFRGVGASAGGYDEGMGETVDAVAAADFMRAEFGDLPLLTAGFSFGAYVQARAALALHPQRMVLVAPAVGRFEMPPVPPDTLLIHGDQDEVVALDALLDWARPQHLPVLVLSGAEHFFHGRLTQLKQLVLQHLRGAV
ncbi:MAG: alpha/beta hydrolase [Gallionella sp.]|nr:alpha/beta hydrolase [Gallionella sp.]